MSTKQRNVLTIATGKITYVNFASNLIHSFLHWHKKSDIQFYLATDQQQYISNYIKLKINIIDIKKGDLGEGFSSKLLLDQLAPDGQTLFIDSDCLIFENLNHLFDLFKGHKVSVVGRYVADGEWFGNIGPICRAFNVPHIPKFNGGIYYIEKGEHATAVYQTARELEKKYDEIGFIRLREHPNDEVIMALAMQLHKQTPLIDNGRILGDLQACQGENKLDVIKGTRSLINPKPPHPLHQHWYPFHMVSPIIVHFLGSYTNHYLYKKEVYRLDKANNKNLNFITELKGLLTIQYPGQLKAILKDVFRPFYRKIFGIRMIKRSPRL